MTMTRYEEQRKETRTHLYYYLKVYEPDSDDLIGHIVDLSDNGALLTTTRQLADNEIVNLMVENSVDYSIHNGTENKAAITAQCRWSKRDDSSGLLDVGLRFTELSGEARQFLDELH